MCTLVAHPSRICDLWLGCVGCGLLLGSIETGSKMGLREILMSAAFAAASSAFLSCAPDEEVCDPVAGTYQPLYVATTGNCGPIAPMLVPLDGGSGGVRTTTEMQFGRDIVTMVVHKGCQLRVTQQVITKEGVMESQLDGGEIAVHSSKSLSGQVSFVRYTPTHDVACQGTYNATFTRPDSVVGIQP